MKARKWIAVILAGGVLLGVGSCASDLAYYAMDAFGDYLPDLLEAWLGTAAETA